MRSHPRFAQLFTLGEGKALGKLKIYDGLTIQSDGDWTACVQCIYIHTEACTFPQMRGNNI